MHIPFLLQGTQANPSMTTPSPSGTSSTPSALSTHTIATGNTPIALSTPGTAGQYTLPLGGLSFSQLAGAPVTSIANTQSVSNTNTSPNAPFNPLSLASWETYGSEVPGYLASTVGNLDTSVSDWLTAQGPLLQGGGPRSVRIPKSVHHRERG